MKALVALAALVAASPAPIPTGPNTVHFAGMPPARYRGEAVTVAVFVDDITPHCGKAPEPLVRLACTDQQEDVAVMYLPNPCPIGELDAYAGLVCHEKGHALGWARTHPE